MSAQKTIAVEVVGENWLQHLIGPALLAAAAILAAGLAAYVSIRNHRHQLEQDREERDREHARESMRAAAKTVAEALDPLGIYEMAVHAEDKAIRHAEAIEESEDTEAKEDAEKQQQQCAEKVSEARSGVGDRLIKTMADSISLRISFGSTSPVFECYRDLSHTLNARFRACAPTVEGRKQREAVEKDSQLEKTRAALNAFQEACEEWAVQQPLAQPSGRFMSKTRPRRRR